MGLSATPSSAITDALTGQRLTTDRYDVHLKPAEARELTTVVVDAISDPEELADVLVRDLTYATGLPAAENDEIARTQAQALIDWLKTGKKLGGPDQQLGPRVY